MTRSNLAFSLCFLLVCLFSVSNGATVFLGPASSNATDVPTCGSSDVPCATLSYIADNILQDGDSISILDGTYLIDYSTSITQSNIEIKSDSSNGVTFQAVGNNSTLISLTGYSYDISGILFIGGTEWFALTTTLEDQQSANFADLSFQQLNFTKKSDAVIYLAIPDLSLPPTITFQNIDVLDSVVYSFILSSNAFFSFSQFSFKESEAQYVIDFNAKSASNTPYELAFNNFDFEDSVIASAISILSSDGTVVDLSISETTFTRSNGTLLSAFINGGSINLNNITITDVASFVQSQKFVSFTGVDQLTIGSIVAQRINPTNCSQCFLISGSLAGSITVDDFTYSDSTPGLAFITNDNLQNDTSITLDTITADNITPTDSFLSVLSDSTIPFLVALSRFTLSNSSFPVPPALYFDGVETITITNSIFTDVAGADDTTFSFVQIVASTSFTLDTVTIDDISDFNSFFNLDGEAFIKSVTYDSDDDVPFVSCVAVSALINFEGTNDIDKDSIDHDSCTFNCDSADDTDLCSDSNLLFYSVIAAIAIGVVVLLIAAAIVIALIVKKKKDAAKYEMLDGNLDDGEYE